MLKPKLTLVINMLTSSGGARSETLGGAFEGEQNPSNRNP